MVVVSPDRIISISRNQGRLLLTVFLALTSIFILSRTTDYDIDPLRAEKRNLPEPDTAFLRKYCDHYVGRGANVTHEFLNIVSHFKTPITILDVGANVGRVSLPAAYCFDVQHKVIAFEPLQENCDLIVSTGNRLGTALYDGRLSLVKGAVADEQGTSTMYFPQNRSDNGALNRKSASLIVKNKLHSETVKVYKGDTFLNREKVRPSLIKIDVQGAEIRVLRGLEQYLRRQRGVLVLAEHYTSLLRSVGHHPLIVYDFMMSLGYSVYCKPRIAVTDGRISVKGNMHSEASAMRQECIDLTYWRDAPQKT